MPDGTLLLTRGEVAALLDLDECIVAVEEAFRLHAEGRSLSPGSLGVEAPGGGFHVKAAGLELSRPYFAAKINANFPDNSSRFGRPSIQGLILLCDAENGHPLAVMDSIHVTILRTGAATAVAAKHLARPDSRVAAICGCGNQGRIQLRALAAVLPLERAEVFDTDTVRAERFARDVSEELGIDARPAPDVASAVGSSDVCVTCTPARRFFLERHMVRPGTFIAAVGADSPHKQELDPELFAESRVVADDLEQCAAFGELHHALDAGQITLGGVHGELAEIVAGQKSGRVSEEEITIFDSTGTALQDVAAAALVYEKARAGGIGRRIDFFAGA